MNACFLYGSLAGDIIGSRFERHNIKIKQFELFATKSHITDDSVMTIATADAIINNIPYGTSYHMWGNRYPRAGYGFSFRRWLTSSSPTPYNSWGNGAAMRVSPIGFVANEMNDVLNMAKLSAEVTHNHPEGIKGAQATAGAIFLARANTEKSNIKKEIEEKFGYDLSSKKLENIRPFYEFDVSCQGTLPVALLAFLESNNYEDAIRNAISIGGDSDTIATITGGIALAYYKEIPAYIVHEIEQRLPPDIFDVCQKFTTYCNASPRII